MLLLIEQWGVRQLEAVFGVFIAVMAGSFGVMYSNADIPQGEVVQGEFAVDTTCSAAGMWQNTLSLAAHLSPRNSNGSATLSERVSLPCCLNSWRSFLHPWAFAGAQA